MNKQNLRVIVASENPRERDFLREIIEGEAGTFFVGQAPDVSRAVTLARNLRPDVAIIDSNLPYFAGGRAGPLPQVGGLDTGQAISEVVPGACVIIVGDLDGQVLAARDSGMGAVAFISGEKIGGKMAQTLHELYQEVTLAETLVFADVEFRALPVSGSPVDQVSEGAIFLGTAAILSGGYLIITFILAPVGIVLVAAGVLAVLFGLTGRLTNSLRRRLFRRGNH